MNTLELKVYDRTKARLAVYEEIGNDDKEVVVGILWVPHIEHTDHDHIEFSKEEAIKLRDWLTEFINE